MCQCAQRGARVCEFCSCGLWPVWQTADIDIRLCASCSCTLPRALVGSWRTPPHTHTARTHTRARADWQHRTLHTHANAHLDAEHTQPAHNVSTARTHTHTRLAFYGAAHSTQDGKQPLNLLHDLRGICVVARPASSGSDGSSEGRTSNTSSSVRCARAYNKELRSGRSRRKRAKYRRGWTRRRKFRAPGASYLLQCGRSAMRDELAVGTGRFHVSPRVTATLPCWSSSGQSRQPPARPQGPWGWAPAP